jgi:hypothetical protein
VRAELAEIFAAASVAVGAAGFVSDTWLLVAGFRFRGNEPPPPRVSQRAPLHLKTTAASEANGAHHRPVTDRSSPKVGDRHSPRSPLPEVKFRFLLLLLPPNIFVTDGNV